MDMMFYNSIVLSLEFSFEGIIFFLSCFRFLSGILLAVLPP